MAINALINIGNLAYGAANEPQYPNEVESAAQLQSANAASLPIWLQEEAAAQEGKNLQVGNGSATTITGYNQTVTVPGGENGTTPTQVPYVASDWEKGGKYNPTGNAKPVINSQPIYGTAKTTKDYNFTGYGTADIEAAQASQAAQSQVALAQQFDPQFIAQALAEENLSNPQGVQARTEENKLIQQEVANPQVNPVAEQLNQQVSQQISAAANNEMTPAEQAQFAADVQAATQSRGSGGAAGTFEQPIVTGASGEQRKQAAAQEGTGWLASGQTPADFSYRQQQQAMADLSAMVNGNTPEAQFRQLSGGQSGPTPTSTATMSQLPNQPNAAQQAGIAQTNTEMNSALNQVNPWALGISSALRVGGLAAGAINQSTPTGTVAGGAS